MGELTPNRKSSALLRHLLEMPASAVYALAAKGQLFNGFELCKQRPISRLAWSEDGAVLNLTFAVHNDFNVSFSLEQGELSGSCDCGVWSPEGRCPHLVASLATLKKAVSPTSFPMLQLPSKYLDGIRRELTQVAPATESPVVKADLNAPYALIVERCAGEVQLRLFQEGVPVTLADSGLPASLKDFLRLLSSPALGGRCIEEFVTRFQGRYPICYAGDQGLVPLRLDSTALRSVLVHLDLRRGELRGSQSLDDGTLFDDESFVSEHYYFDLRQGRIQKLAEAGHERYYQRLSGALAALPESSCTDDPQGFIASAEDFNRLQFTLKDAELSAFLKRAVLTRDGARCQLRSFHPLYRLNIEELGDTVHLMAEGVAEEVRFPLSRELFWFFPAAGRQHHPQPLRAKKRVAAIFDACFSALAGHTRSERERIARLALDTPEFSKRGVRAEARQIVNGFWETAGEPHTLLQLSEVGWLGLAVDGVRQAQLLEIPYQLFGAEIFSGATEPGEMYLDRKTFLKGLSRLREQCVAGSFGLAIGGEELETVTWSFTLDATRSSIDWFELRPEIRFEGELVDEREFQEAVKGGGLFRKGEQMVLLDEESSRALTLFAGHAKREVVRVPRLQILDWIVLRRSGVRVLLAPQEERIIDSLLNFQSIERTAVPAGLKATLRNYQVEGYSWLAFLYQHRFGACLADDMGLGKTIQAIALMAGLKEGIIPSEVSGDVPHLVVVPPSLIFNWESEIARFYPGFKVGVYRGQGRKAEFHGFDLVLTSYGVIQRDVEQLAKLNFHVVVFDEAQAVKNIHAETTGAVRRLKGRFKVTLTGTPVENHLGEYYSVMDLALPGLLGNYELFRRGMGREGSAFLDLLVRRTRPFILRRTKDMIAAELPPKVETDLYLEMSPRQKALYARTVAQVKATVAEAYASKAPGQARIIALTAILKLRQICLSSRLMLTDAHDASPKIEFLIEQVQELFAEGHSVLVFSQFTSFLDLVQEALNGERIQNFRLDGSTPVSRRKALVENFQDSAEPAVFLLSLKAGGRGLNLTRASYVFHLDPWWNPAVENQASDRAHRIGQQRQVTITRLLMRHSIEEKMMELKKRKLKLYRALLEDAESDAGQSLGREDFEFLLGT
ncbi:hypothetical protein GMLC_27210 [Geomonas limicola]|uniref:Helicase n=1 Tax=Geomonas limicola TaxID=2740186 RepID=A0A6V8N979_9BACT|nr:DEAD/DEAH box helicase [Geomonas limicola]GFO69142.1 hypothetical protein GMLC_27210 [Geomonas limicola]